MCAYSSDKIQMHYRIVASIDGFLHVPRTSVYHENQYANYTKSVQIPVNDWVDFEEMYEQEDCIVLYLSILEGISLGTSCSEAFPVRAVPRGKRQESRCAREDEKRLLLERIVAMTSAKLFSHE